MKINDNIQIDRFKDESHSSPNVVVNLLPRLDLNKSKPSTIINPSSQQKPRLPICSWCGKAKNEAYQLNNVDRNYSTMLCSEVCFMKYRRVLFKTTKFIRSLEACRIKKIKSINVYLTSDIRSKSLGNHFQLYENRQKCLFMCDQHTNMNLKTTGSISRNLSVLPILPSSTKYHRLSSNEHTTMNIPFSFLNSYQSSMINLDLHQFQYLFDTVASTDQQIPWWILPIKISSERMSSTKCPMITKEMLSNYSCIPWSMPIPFHFPFQLPWIKSVTDGLIEAHQNETQNDISRLPIDEQPSRRISVSSSLLSINKFDESIR